MVKAIRRQAHRIKPGTNKTVKIELDCKIPADDNILDPKGLEEFLRSHIKVEGKTNNFEKVDKQTGTHERLVSIDAPGSGKQIVIEAVLPFRKRYIKYLTKRYLAKQQIRDFLRVIATGKEKYQLRYFAVNKWFVKITLKFIKII